jgi:hypothetical protein
MRALSMLVASRPGVVGTAPLGLAWRLGLAARLGLARRLGLASRLAPLVVGTSA